MTPSVIQLSVMCYLSDCPQLKNKTICPLKMLSNKTSEEEIHLCSSKCENKKYYIVNSLLSLASLLDILGDFLPLSFTQNLAYYTSYLKLKFLLKNTGLGGLSILIHTISHHSYF